MATRQEIINAVVQDAVEGILASFKNRLLSIIIMGSILDHALDPVQDIDFIILTEDETPFSDLVQLGQSMDDVTQQHTFPSTKVVWACVDGPWSIGPQAEFTIGLHLNVQGLSQHHRRIERQPILAISMFKHCKVLFGTHPLDFGVPFIQGRTCTTDFYGLIWLRTLLLTSFSDRSLDKMARAGVMKYCSISTIRNYVILTSERIPKNSREYCEVFEQVCPFDEAKTILLNAYRGNVTPNTDVATKCLAALDILTQDIENRR